MLFTLQNRLLASYILVLTLAIVVVTGYLLFAFRDFYLGLARADLEERATYVAETLAREGGISRPERVAEVMDRFRHHTTLTVRVIDPRGRLVASSRHREHPGTPMIALPGVQEALSGRVAAATAVAARGPSERLYVAVPVRRSPHVGDSPSGVVRISLPLRDVNATLARLQATVALGLLLAFAACGLLSAWLARSIGAPLRQMSDLAEQIRAGRFGAELSLRSRDDIGRLAEAMNAMSRRLEEQESERTAFLAAASHELRTPVSNIRAALEALLAGGDALPGPRARFLRGALGEAARLGRLVEELMDLAYLEAGVTRLELRPVSLSGLIDQTLAAVAPRLKEKELSVRLAIDPLTLTHGDPGRLEQVLTNLIENAIRHSPPRGALAITAATEGSQVRVTFQDEGPGIPVEALPHVFERFFTADASRRRSEAVSERGKSGAGLGLYIVKKLVEAHGGSVEAANVPGAGACLTIRLPSASRAAAPPTERTPVRLGHD